MSAFHSSVIIKSILFFCLVVLLSACTQSLPNPQNYAGSAKRTETSCLSTCDSCTTDDNLELSFDTNMHVRGITTGSSIAYGKTCIFRDTVSWIFEGTYQADNNSFTITSCNNGEALGEGEGFMGDGKSSGWVYCHWPSRPQEEGMRLKWADVPIIKGK